MKRVSGQALNNGVIMVSDRSVILVRNKDGGISEKIDRFSYSKNNIPVLRGIIHLLKQSKFGFGGIYFSVKNSNDKKSFFLLILLAIFYYFYPYIINTKKIFISDDYIDAIFFAMFVIFMLTNKFIRNTLKYHGAEHKTVNCYEDNCELTIDNVKKYPKEHVRCGTSLMVVLILLSIFFEIIISFLSGNYKIIGYILFLPLLLGISYEVMLIILKKQENIFSKLFINIGLKAQKLTTREPDYNQIEIAIEALKKAIEK
ncbi:MAG: DUF1385 domain-containing protein [Clostridiales bacterium]